MGLYKSLEANRQCGLAHLASFVCVAGGSNLRGGRGRGPHLARRAYSPAAPGAPQAPRWGAITGPDRPCLPGQEVERAAEPLGLRCGASRGRLLWRAATTTMAARQKKTRRQEVAIGVENERCTAKKLTPLDPWPWRE